MSNMATDGPTPPDCDHEIFEQGKPIALIDGSSNAVERWVKAVAVKADARLDWHYSGGVAQVLHLGDAESWARTEAAIDLLESSLNGTIMRRLPAGAPGLYRRGVTPVPDGAIAGFYDGGDSSTYIVGT